jgi:NAD-dependent DNA ligase (contains BRCT domain type II)
MTIMARHETLLKTQALSKERKRNSYLYYVEDKPTLTDSEYDSPKHELRDIETEDPGTRDAGLPRHQHVDELPRNRGRRTCITVSRS